MCEGKFLVKTTITDNVIRHVKVDHFRFGVRVIKKSEGWTCQDLNQSRQPMRNNSLLLDDNNHSKNISSTSLFDCSGNLSSPSTSTSSLFQCIEVVDKQKRQSKEAVNNDNTFCSLNNNKKSSSINGVNNLQSTSSESLSLSSSLNGYYHNCDNIILSKVPTTSIKPVIRQEDKGASGGTEKQSHLKYPPVAAGTLGAKKGGGGGGTKNLHNNKISTKTKHHFNSQYLSKVLGKSPLLKLQLLNLLVVPVDGRQGCPELVPVGTISSLKKSMLFDDDGSERSGSGSIHENNSIRPRDIEDDRLDTKRVKIEVEDDNDLVIDENAMDVADIISEESSSIESNLEASAIVELLDNIAPKNNNNKTTTTITMTPTTTPNSNSAGPASIEKRSSSSSSVASSQGNKSISDRRPISTLTNKNGHDGKVSKVNDQNRKSVKHDSNSYEDCNNTTSNRIEKNNNNSTTCAASMVLRLEKEIMSLTTLLKVKEREWNAIIRLKKLKELALDIFRRQQEIDQLNDTAESQQNSDDFASLLTKINVETEQVGAGEAQTRLSAEKTEKEIKEEEKKLKTYRIQHDESATTTSSKKESSKDSNKQNSNNVASLSASLALQQLCERNRSSLLQTSGSSPPATAVQINNNNNNSSSSGGIHNKVIGEGRQGAIVEVRSIIADHRSKYPEEVVAHSPSQERKKTTSRRGTSTLHNNVHGSSTSVLMPQDPNISYADHLANLVQLSQKDKMGASISSPQENVTMNARSISKSNNAIMMQSTSFASPRGQLSTAISLAKLLSSNSSVSIPVIGGIAHSSDETSSIAPHKSDSGNHMANDSSSLSLASLLASSSKGREDDLKGEEEDNAPVCQGCNLNRAQFVCAGCANQWYCSRECQIAAWDEHSDVCSG